MSKSNVVEITEKFQAAYAEAAVAALVAAFPGCKVKYSTVSDGTLRPFVVADAPIPGNLTPEETAQRPPPGLG